MSEPRARIRRARERAEAKAKRPKYPAKAQKGGPSIVLIHKNRRHRGDDLDYFKAR